MATIVETKNLADLYDLPPVDWSAVTAPLDRGVTQAPDSGGPDRVVRRCFLLSRGYFVGFS